MNEFLELAIKDSGMTKADIARQLGVTPQAVGKATKSDTVKPLTAVQILRVCGWDDARIGDIRLSDIYKLDTL